MEKYLKNALLITGMELNSSWIAVAALLSLMMPGCSEDHAGNGPGTGLAAVLEDARPSARERLDKLEAQAQCGVIRFKPPYCNVTGYLTASVIPNSSIYLYAPQDTTYDRIMNISHGCRPLVRFNISSNGTFQFHTLPAGNYAAVVPAHRFKHGQGFPIIHEFNQSGCQAEIAWHGGDSRYSVLVFSIKSVSPN